MFLPDKVKGSPRPAACSRRAACCSPTPGTASTSTPAPADRRDGQAPLPGQPSDVPRDAVRLRRPRADPRRHGGGGLDGHRARGRHASRRGRLREGFRGRLRARHAALGQLAERGADADAVIQALAQISPPSAASVRSARAHGHDHHRAPLSGLTSAHLTPPLPYPTTLHPASYPTIDDRPASSPRSTRRDSEHERTARVCARLRAGHARARVSRALCHAASCASVVVFSATLRAAMLAPA